MAAGRKKRADKPKPPKRSAANTEKILERLQEVVGSASAVDIAKGISNALGGPEGIGELYEMLLTDKTANAATRARILAQGQTFIAMVERKHGNIDRIKNMEKKDIEQRMVELWDKHNRIVPIRDEVFDAWQAETKKVRSKGGRQVEGGDAGEPDTAEGVDTTGAMDGGGSA